MRVLQRPLREQDGAISVMAGVLAAAMLLATSLAVDVGRVAFVSRDQQGVTDRAALDAMRVLAATTATQLAELHDQVAGAVDASLDRNQQATGTSQDRLPVRIGLGRVQDGYFAAICDDDPDTADIHSCADEDANIAGRAAPWTISDVNAIEVVIGSVVPYLFAIGATADELTGVAGRRVIKVAQAGLGDPLGGVSAATSAVNLGDGLVTTLLSRMLGASTDLSLVGWNGLLQTEVTMRAIAAQIGAGTVSELLDAELTVGQLATVIAQALSADSDLDADTQATLLELATATLGVGLGPVRIGDFLAIDSSTGSSAMDAAIDAGGLLLGFAQVANHQHAVAATLDVLGAPVNVWIIQPPQVAFGRPGQDANGDWRTQATTAQVAVDIGLPLMSASATVSRSGTYSTQLFRDRINAISTCSGAVSQAQNTAGRVRGDLQRAIDAYKEAASLLGVVVDALVATINGLLGTLDTLLASVSCLLTPNSTRDRIKSDLHKLVDEYEKLVEAVGGALDDAGVAVPTNPVLRVRLASGSVALDTITCGDPTAAGTHVEGILGAVRLTSADQVAANPNDPAPQSVQLLDLDLGPFGRVGATLSADATLGSFVDWHEFLGPFASDAERFSSGELGTPSLMSMLDLTVDPANVLGLPVARIVDPAVASVMNLLAAVLAPVDAVLARTVDVLGLDLGNVEGRVLAARCEGPPRLLPRPPA